MRRSSLDVVVTENDETLRWLPKNTNSVSSEKYCEKQKHCEKQWRYGIQKLKVRETSVYPCTTKINIVL